MLVIVCIEILSFPFPNLPPLICYPLPVRQASLSLSAFGLADGVGGWADRVRGPTWLRCIRLVFPPKVDSPPMMPFKKDNRFKIEHLDPLCQSIHWQGDPDDWHPGREEQKLHQICPFWHLSFFYLFSCIVNILLGFVFIPRISHSEFLTGLKPTCHPTKGVDAGQFSRALTGTSDWSWLAEVAVPPTFKTQGFFHC